MGGGECLETGDILFATHARFCPLPFSWPIPYTAAACNNELSPPLFPPAFIPVPQLSLALQLLCISYELLLT